MSREKQIEEMAEDLRACHTEFYCNAELYTDYDDMARNLIDKGYRKQSENTVELPCKFGDSVYCITECSCENIDGVHTECEFYGYGEDDRICSIPNGAKCPYQYRIEKCYTTETNILMFKRMLGKTAFLTKEGAEQALAKMKGGEDNA